MKYAIERIRVGKGEYKFQVWVDNPYLKNRFDAMTCGWICKIGADGYNSSVKDSYGLGVIYPTLAQAGKAVHADILHELELDGMGSDWEYVASGKSFDCYKYTDKED